MFKFVFDRRNDSRPYPNLAPWADDPHSSYGGLGDSYPYIAPCRLLLYAHDHDYPVSISYMDEPIPDNAYYPVGIAWFDFSLDYFGLMSPEVRTYLRTGQLRVLFYYHEGDNPEHEQARLNALCTQHDLPTTCYRFVSGNTACEALENFVYFADHELFYWRNAVRWNDRSQPGCSYHTRPRSRKFTALNRFHKWWRATIMSDLTLHRQLLTNRNSYWSYNGLDMGDQYHDNPIRIDEFAGLADSIKEFLLYTPYRCDELTADEHNQHWTLVPEHYDDAYCNLVFETFFDADTSGGAFISEKTFKPIRHAQPFVVFGTVDTLATLRRLGYRTFDHVIDNGYDSELDNTERYIRLRHTIEQLNAQDLHELYIRCREDIIHNQELFLASKYARLEELAMHLNAV
jgi:hypothetical protein